MISNNFFQTQNLIDNSIEILLLGAAQDGGYPQFGCKCQNCSDAYNNKSLSDSAVSIAIIDKTIKKWWLVDASPQLAQQWTEFAPILSNYEISGILLTHAHAGHYPGLIYFGKECLNAKQIPIYASSQMLNFLQKNEPWAVMFKNQNLVAVEIKDQIYFKLSDLVKVQPLLVTHRADFTDTFAFKIYGPDKNCFYCPDIDCWDGLDQSLIEITSTMDILMLDATFYDDDELPGRDMRTIPHPRVVQTVQLLSKYKFQCDVYLIHINHSNKLWVDKQEIYNLEQKGIKVARKGLQWKL